MGGTRAHNGRRDDATVHPVASDDDPHPGLPRCQDEWTVRVVVVRPFVIRAFPVTSWRSRAFAGRASARAATQNSRRLCCNWRARTILYPQPRTRSKYSGTCSRQIPLGQFKRQQHSANVHLGIRHDALNHIERKVGRNIHVGRQPPDLAESLVAALARRDDECAETADGPARPDPSRPDRLRGHGVLAPTGPGSPRPAPLPISAQRAALGIGICDHRKASSIFSHARLTASGGNSNRIMPPGDRDGIDRAR